MGSPFYSPTELFRAPHFVVNLIIAIGGAVIIVLVAAFLLNQTKITITPIASLRAISHQDASYENNVKPIESLLTHVSVGYDTNTKPTVYGYLIDLSDVCNKLGHADSELLDARALIEPKIVLVRTRDGFTAGTAVINKKTCDIVKRLKEPLIYLASDTEVPSSGPKKFWMVEALIN